jgi:hypothetical protein
VPASRDNVGVTLQHQALWRASSSPPACGSSTTTASATHRAAHRGAWSCAQGGRLGATRVSASAGSGIKEPTVSSRSARRRSSWAIPDLLPERRARVEWASSSAWPTIASRLNWRGSTTATQHHLARTRLHHVHVAVLQHRLTDARGLELSGDVALVVRHPRQGGYTFTDSEILESTSDSEALPAGQLGVPPAAPSGFVDVAWNGSRASVDSAARSSAPRGQRLLRLDPPISKRGVRAWDLRGSFA